MKRVFNYLIAFIVLAGIFIANGCAIETENQPQISTDEPKAIETQVIPTKTKVPTPTRKATETQAPTPTKTETPEKYPIDVNKIHNFPESYEYMVNNLNEFVEFPDPFVDPDGFNASVEKLKTIIGDYTQRERNYTASSGEEPDFYVANAFLSPNQLEGQPEIAYFKHQGVVYPMIGLNVYGTDSVPGMGSTRTLLVILYNGYGAPEGTDVIKTLAEGGHIRGIALRKTEKETFPEIVNKAVRIGIVPVDDGTYDQIIFGFGRIQTEEGFQKMINGN